MEFDFIKKDIQFCRIQAIFTGAREYVDQLGSSLV